ncbi:MAG: peptide chain release factor N(5)-glutamine methyltransferase [Candidatus Didemnitutus sp.]|nr:peptide chain release factor N(5)-glutamine methyltransferase [Candidatus Didemnitutus sp.]
MLTVLEILKRTAEFLAKHGVESSRLNAELLVGHSLGLQRMQLYLQFERPLTEPELVKLRPLVKRRSEREPLQYIVGSTDFAGIKLKVDRRALIPRPESELLLEFAKEKFAQTPARILDLGTGSGALALALAHLFPIATITAVDFNPAALELAAENAALLSCTDRVRFLRSSWFDDLPPESAFELIVANPPYLSEAEMKETEPEVKDFEPGDALSSGPTGLEAVEAIIRTAKGYLAPLGLLMMETGIDQHRHLVELARTRGYSQVESRQDLTGRDRFILAAP